MTSVNDHVMLYPCGCSVGRAGSGGLDVTSVGACDHHRPMAALALGALAIQVMHRAIESGSPTRLSSAKMADSLDETLKNMLQKEGPTDGSA